MMFSHEKMSDDGRMKEQLQHKIRSLGIKVKHG
jgi:hypothetical protein